MDPVFFQGPILEKILYYLPSLETISLIAAVTQDYSIQRIVNCYLATRVEKNGFLGKLPTKHVYRQRARRTNSFQQYVVDFRQRNPSVSHWDVFQLAARDWRQLSTEEKDHYHQQTTILNKKYRQEFEQEEQIKVLKDF